MTSREEPSPRVWQDRPLVKALKKRITYSSLVFPIWRAPRRIPALQVIIPPAEQLKQIARIINSRKRGRRGMDPEFEIFPERHWISKITCPAPYAPRKLNHHPCNSWWCPWCHVRRVYKLFLRASWYDWTGAEWNTNKRTYLLSAMRARPGYVHKQLRRFISQRPGPARGHGVTLSMVYPHGRRLICLKRTLWLPRRIAPGPRDGVLHLLKAADVFGAFLAFPAPLLLGSNNLFRDLLVFWNKAPRAYHLLQSYGACSRQHVKMVVDNHRKQRLLDRKRAAQEQAATRELGITEYNDLNPDR